MEGRIKTLGEVQREMRRQSADVIRSSDYLKDLIEDPISFAQKYNKGFGLYHDGWNETHYLVQRSIPLIQRQISKYPYICRHWE